MAYLLFPGRHLLTTKFQEEYLWEVLPLPIKKLELWGETQVDGDETIHEIIFAITSANQANSRYNPVSFWARTILLDRFARQYKENLGIRYRIIGIPHFPPTERFTDFLIKEIHESTHGTLALSPKNTIVLCSTPSLITLYRQRGYAILPAEYDPEAAIYKKEAPTGVIQAFFGNEEGLVNMNDLLSRSTLQVWDDFPEVPETIRRIWRDPLLTESGSLTKERNYSTYASGMNHGALMELKYNDIKEAIVPGKIVDEGCADGALLVRVAKDFPDSDLIGIEITSEFMARCIERQRAGEFGETFVHFHQRNLLDPIFEDESIEAVICNSTTHEIWSYGNREESLMHYLRLKFAQLKPGGRLIIRDVVGPEDKERIVYLKADREDGDNEEIFKEYQRPEELSGHLARLSTYARFKRFAEDFLADMRRSGKRGAESKISYEEIDISGVPYFAVRLKDAVEFMTKKDYVDNWRSELNEEFAFMSFSEWKELLKTVGFKIIENPNEPAKSSRAYANDWIVENRFRGKTDIFEMRNSLLDQLQYPVTNMVLIAEKPESAKSSVDAD